MKKRRQFIQAMGLMGLSLPMLEKFSMRKSQFTGMTDFKPIILCSRGNDWAAKVLEPGWAVYKANGNIMDAVEISANVCELDPADMSVGYGGLPNERGVVTLDASCMYGPTHKCGSVAALEKIKKAASVARLVMERTDHALIVGEGALEFARAHGFPEENLLTEEARLVWLKWKENLSTQDDWLPPADGVYRSLKRKTGTINILGMSERGEVAGITTTSGLFGKLNGRVGDSPIIGAGLYVDNEVGAAGATGRGEELLRSCGSFLLVEKMRAGKSPQQACEEVVQRIVDLNGGKPDPGYNVKMVAFNKDGEVGVASVTQEGDIPPYASVITNDGITVYPGKSMKSFPKED
jgi:N4-(beta-N-acetylglucosaminyl)-L-asparaginase